MSDNFEREVESAVSSLSDAPVVQDLAPELQDQLRQVEALASMDPGFAGTKEYQDLIASISQASSQADEDEDYEDEDEEDEEDEEDDVVDIFGIMKEPKKGKEFRLNFQPPKEMVDLISSKFGIKNPETFFSSVDTWRNQAQEGSELKKEYEALTSDLNAMPYELRLGIQMWANGEDFTRAFDSSGRLDFSGDFGKQSPESLVQHYFGDQYEELLSDYENGDLSDSEYESRLKLLANSTKRMFSEDKQALDKEREDYLNRQKSEFQNMKKTAILSVENLSKAYPDFSKAEINKIRSILVEGKVDNLFMNADGTYNDDAAELVAYAMYGKKMLESVKKIAQRKGETEANQRIVDSSPKSVRKQKAAMPTGVDQKALGHLSGLFKNDPYA
jgi:hypothetical protein